MFGKLVPIRDAFPNYMLDFQERADARPESRWVDRLTTDGTWSGNLFDFYQLVIQRHFRDLRVPFQLRGDTRIDETPVHEALGVRRSPQAEPVSTSRELTGHRSPARLRFRVCW